MAPWAHVARPAAADTDAHAATMADPPTDPEPDTFRTTDMTASVLQPSAKTQPAAGPIAPAQATAPRLDLYVVIHKTLRRMMSQTLVRLGCMDVTDEADMADALRAVDGLLEACMSHLKHENDFVHAAIEARRPGGAAKTAGDHVEHVDAIETLAAEVRALRAAAVEQRATLALRLYRHLSLFVAENFEHMHIEETANNATLWALYTDEELLEIHDRLIASVPPAEMFEILRWAAPALAPQELAAVLGGMQAGAPPEAFRAVMDMVRGQIDDTRWLKLTRALGLPQVPGLVEMR